MNIENIIAIISDNEKAEISKDKNKQLDGFLITVSAKPELGFNFGYLLYVPLILRDNPILIVEGATVDEVGPIDRARKIVYDKAIFELSTGGFPHLLAKELKCPVIMQLFPRPEDKENKTNIFTHALTSMAMSVKNTPIERVDLQLIKIFNEIKYRFLRADIALYDKFILKGFSAGGAFAHRFTLLHPQYVLAAVGGGNMHSFTLPLKTYKDEILIWPNGMGNADHYCNFDYDEYKKVKQLFYMGDKDFNDPVPYSDSYTEEERQQVYRLFGKIGMPDRWNKYQEAILSLGLSNIICKTIKDIDHRPGNEIRNFIIQYLNNIVTTI